LSRAWLLTSQNIRKRGHKEAVVDSVRTFHAYVFSTDDLHTYLEQRLPWYEFVVYPEKKNSIPEFCTKGKTTEWFFNPIWYEFVV